MSEALINRLVDLLNQAINKKSSWLDKATKVGSWKLLKMRF
jgi:hypothetical protein